MRLETKFEATCIGKKAEPSKDGKTTYYRCSIEQNEDATTLNVSQEVFDRLEKYKKFKFTAVYDDKNEYFRVVGAFPEEGSKSTAASTAKEK